jgi:DNA-binding transcriptional ArsR family regulator
MFLPGKQGDLPAYFTALANIVRLRIVEELASGGDMTVNELARALRISQPRVSWHLRLLELGGVVRTRREGRLTYCSLDPDTIRRRLTDFEAVLESRRFPATAIRREVST